MAEKLNFSKKIVYLLGLAFILGAFVMVVIRFVTYKSSAVHYHANFGLYVNGQRDVFKGPGYYEEVTACKDENSNDPKDRAHMHSNVNDVVHVHASGVTWSQFFTNLGYTLSDDLIETSQGVFQNGQDGKKLTFILNNQAVDSIANRVIGDKDVLLISYGSDNQAAQQKQYDSIAHTASQYDSGHDPASCSGGEKVTFTKRLKIALGFNQ